MTLHERTRQRIVLPSGVILLYEREQNKKRGRRLDNFTKLNKTDELEVIGRDLIVNGRPFNVFYPSEPLFGVKDGKLITIVFRGCGCTLTDWEPEEIEGEYIG